MSFCHGSLHLWIHPVHRAIHSQADTNLIRIFLDSDPLSVLKKTHAGLTPLQIAASEANYTYNRDEESLEMQTR